MSSPADRAEPPEAPAPDVLASPLLLLPGKGKGVRFAVGSPAGPRSAVWRIFASPEGIYLAPLHVLKASKISIHRSGKCYHSLLEKDSRESSNSIVPEHALEAWEVSAPRDPGFAYAVVINFPACFLTSKPYRDTASVVWLPTPGPDKMVQVIVVKLTRRIARMTLQGLLHLGHWEVSNGDQYVILAKETSFDRAAFIERHGTTVAEMRFVRGAKRPISGDVYALLGGSDVGDPSIKVFVEAAQGAAVEFGDGPAEPIDASLQVFGSVRQSSR